MSEEMFSVGYWLIQAAATAPVLVMLLAGLVICYRQRRRRPRVAKLLGFALLAELIWLTVGWPLLYMALAWLGASNANIINDINDSSWMLQMILHSLPGSTVSAMIWGTVLWAVLKVDDWQDGSADV